jgi:3,4-dihydroxy 2-butanone 4-phosphate synthase
MRMESGDAVALFGQNYRSPGHVPICVASEQPLKSRFGHTELSVALLTMAGMTPVAVGCEMMSDDGGSLSRDEAKAYADSLGAPFLEGSQIIERWRKWSG